MAPTSRAWRGEWLGWARTPGHDAYWHYRGAFFAPLPAPGGPVLEVGCGEGRVTRDLRERGYDVTGLDLSPTLIAAASEQDPGGAYVEAAAEALPFGDAELRAGGRLQQPHGRRRPAGPRSPRRLACSPPAAACARA